MDEVLPVLLEQTAPGRYSAAGMPNLSGPWEVVFLAHDPETGEEMRGQMAVYNNGGAEGRRSADPAELERIAEISGGRILGPGGPRFNPERIAAARVGLRGVLVFFMLVTFLADLAVRTGAVPARFIASRTPRRQVRA
jgi:hypothetical protein